MSEITLKMSFEGFAENLCEYCWWNEDTDSNGCDKLAHNSEFIECSESTCPLTVERVQEAVRKKYDYFHSITINPCGFVGILGKGGVVVETTLDLDEWVEQVEKGGE